MRQTVNHNTMFNKNRQDKLPRLSFIDLHALLLKKYDFRSLLSYPPGYYITSIC